MYICKQLKVFCIIRIFVIKVFHQQAFFDCLFETTCWLAKTSTQRTVVFVTYMQLLGAFRHSSDVSELCRKGPISCDWFYAKEIFKHLYQIIKSLLSVESHLSKFVKINNISCFGFIFVETLSAVTFPQSSYKYPYVQGHWNGSWILDDGSPLLYTNWDINNPRELEKQPYIKVTESGWRTAVNEKTRPIICSYKL